MWERPVTRYATIVLLSISIQGCKNKVDDSILRVSRFSMGTVVDYSIVGVSDASFRQAVADAHEEIDRVSSLLWEDDSSSVIFRLNRSPDTVRIGPEALSFLQRVKRYHRETGGAFDATVKPVLALYDFVDGAKPPSDARVTAALALTGMDGLAFADSDLVVKGTPDLALAVGGVAKGYAVDRAIGVLRDSGVKDAIVNAGGDLYCMGRRNGHPWRVGVRDPDDPDSMIAVLHVSNMGVATSGDYQQYFDYEGVRYHHIIDPSNGFPARKIRSATVIASTAERADALATASFVLGPVEGIAMLESLGVEGMLVDPGGRIHTTAGLSRYLGSADN